MPAPDFSKLTTDTLARRARFQCSNPDCRTHTVGPNKDPKKSTTIGEAAHIYGAKLTAARYLSGMSNATRASITNGIWLCRNCHKKIDRDVARYPADLLFAWRKAHEDWVHQGLGTTGQRIRHEVEMTHFEFLKGYPPIISRIAIDKPDGWEWRFTAELMRYLNEPQFKRLHSLRAGEYYRAQPRVRAEDFIDWLNDRTHVMSCLTEPLKRLFVRLTASWGEPGEQGSTEEIHDVCILMRDMLKEMIDHEETLLFTNIPKAGEDLRSLLIDAVGRNADKLAQIPEKLDEVIAMIQSEHSGTSDQPLIINYEITFDLPENFVETFDEALLRFSQHLANRNNFS